MSEIGSTNIDSLPTIQEDNKIYLNKWLDGITSDDTFMMSSDKILTLAEPTMQILDIYKGLV